MPKGKIFISLDFECAWGLLEQAAWQEKEKNNIFNDLRPRLKSFIELLSDLEIKCTWATVGAMIDCAQLSDLDHLQGTYRESAKFFLANAKQSSYDGRDLLDTVLSCSTLQEFGTHTYSHFRVSDNEQNSQSVYEDIRKAKEANSKYGIASDVLVFPRNEFGYFDELQSLGISKVRLPATSGPNPFKRRSMLIRGSHALFSKPSTAIEKQHENGLQLHYASELLNWGASPSSLKVSLTKRRINNALKHAEAGNDIHLWLHPFDLVEAPRLWPFCISVFNKVADARNNGKIEIGLFK